MERRTKYLTILTSVARLIATCLTVGFIFVSTAQAQLNENCVVSVLNRNVQVRQGGTVVSAVTDVGERSALSTVL